MDLKIYTYSYVCKIKRVLTRLPRGSRKSITRENNNRSSGRPRLKKTTSSRFSDRVNDYERISRTGPEKRDRRVCKRLAVDDPSFRSYRGRDRGRRRRPFVFTNNRVVHSPRDGRLGRASRPVDFFALPIVGSISENYQLTGTRENYDRHAGWTRDK